MPDRTLRMLIMGDNASALEALEGTAVAADTASAEMDDKLGASGSRIGGIFEKLGGTLSNWGLPFGESLTKMGDKMDNAGSKGDSLIAKMSGIGKVALAAGAVGIVALGGEALELADKFDTATSAMDTAIKNTGGNLSKLQPGLNKTYSGMASLGFNAIDTANALTPLITASGSTTKAEKDLSIAADLAREKHISLTAAAGMLTKVYAGSTRALTQLGLNLDIGSGKLAAIKTATESVTKAQLALKNTQEGIADGSIKAAQAGTALTEAHFNLDVAENKLKTDQGTIGKIMDTVAQKTRGAAEAYGKTLGGQMKIAGAELENVGIKIGEALIPKIEDLVGIGTKIIEFFMKNKDAAIALGVAIGGPLVAAMTVAAVEIGGNMVRSVIKFGEALLNPIDHLRAAAAGSSEAADTAGQLAAAISSLEGKLGILADTQATETEAQTAVTAAWSAASDAAATISEGYAELSAAADVAAESMGTLATAAETTAEVMETAGPEAGEGFDAMLGPIGLVIIAGTLIATHWKLVEHLLEDAWTAIKSAAETVWSAIKAPFDDFLSFIEQWGPLIAEVLLAPFTAGMSVILPEIIEHWSAIASFFESIPGKIESFFASAGTWLLHAGETVLGGLITGLEYLSPLYWVLKYKSDILAAFSDAVHWLEDVGKAMIQGLINGVDSMVDKAKSVIGDVVKGIKDVVTLGGLIGSPSPWFTEVGHAIGQGLTNGLNDSGGSALAALQRTANSLKSVPFSAVGSSVAAGLAGGSSNPYAVGGGAAGAGGTTGASGDLHITMNMNGQQLATAILPDFRTVALTSKRGTVNLGLS